MTIGSLINAFVADVDIDATKVIRRPNIVLFFGGLVHKDQEDSSVRNLILKRHFRKLPPGNIVCPEDFKGWVNCRSYDDLLSFEEDLAWISSLVILILESEGSIAELGAFVQIPALSRNLIVAVPEKENRVDSFIKLGLLQRLKVRRPAPEPVYVYPWDLKNPQTFSEFVEHFSERLNAFWNSNSQRHDTFNLQDQSHVSLLIADLIELFQAVRLGEIIDIIHGLGIDISEKRVKEILFSQETIGLIAMVEYGNNKFYRPIPDAVPFIDYSYLSVVSQQKGGFSRERLKAKIFSEIQRDTERRHVRNISRADS